MTMKQENKRNKHRKQFFANTMHRELFWLVFVAAVLPALLTAVSLYYLIFNITAEQLIIPEAVYANVIPAAKKVAVILLTTLPACLIALMALAHRITHRIVGPFDRIVRELDECIEGKRKGPIILRRNDRFQPLVEKINTLIARIK